MLDIINKLSFESNLSISKIINILVEEALHKRGIFNIKNSNFYNKDETISIQKENNIKIKNDDKDLSHDFNKFRNNNTQCIEDVSDEFIDKEIYAKFLMFLQFQEKMKKEKP